MLEFSGSYIIAVTNQMRFVASCKCWVDTGYITWLNQRWISMYGLFHNPVLATSLILVGGLEHVLFSHILGISPSQLIIY